GPVGVAPSENPDASDNPAAMPHPARAQREGTVLAAYRRPRPSLVRSTCTDRPGAAFSLTEEGTGGRTTIPARRGNGVSGAFAALAGALLVLGGLALPPPPAADAAAVVSRVSGPDRYGTAAALSHATFAPGVGVVYIATGEHFPDALAGGPAAGADHGPVLLVRTGSIPAATAGELTRLHPGAINILGGPTVVSSGVEAALHAYSAHVGRSFGPDRYATSVAVSVNTFSAPRSTVFIATGLDFPDALSSAPPAGQAHGPVLLVPGTCVPSEINAEIDRLNPSSIVIVGNTSAVGPGVETRTPCGAPGPLPDPLVGPAGPTGPAGPPGPA